MGGRNPFCQLRVDLRMKKKNRRRQGSRCVLSFEQVAPGVNIQKGREEDWKKKR